MATAHVLDVKRAGRGSTALAVWTAVLLGTSHETLAVRIFRSASSRMISSELHGARERGRKRVHLLHRQGRPVLQNQLGRWNRQEEPHKSRQLGLPAAPFPRPPRYRRAHRQARQDEVT